MAVIEDPRPSAELIVFKVANAEGHASEWDVPAPVAAQSGAALVNVSLAFEELNFLNASFDTTFQAVVNDNPDTSGKRESFR